MSLLQRSSLDILPDPFPLGILPNSAHTTHIQGPSLDWTPVPAQKQSSTLTPGLLLPPPQITVHFHTIPLCSHRSTTTVQNTQPVHQPSALCLPGLLHSTQAFQPPGPIPDPQWPITQPLFCPNLLIHIRLGTNKRHSHEISSPK